MYFPLTRTRNQKLNGFDMKNAYWMTGCLFLLVFHLDSGSSLGNWQEVSWPHFFQLPLVATALSTCSQTRMFALQQPLADFFAVTMIVQKRSLGSDFNHIFCTLASEPCCGQPQQHHVWYLPTCVCVCVTVPGVNLGIECMIVLPQIQRLLRICFNYEFGKSVNPTIRHAQLLLMIWFTSLLSLSLSFLWASSSSRPPADRSWDRTKILFGISPTTGWWFQLCFIFHNIWNNNPNLLIFFRGVETTNHQPEQKWWYNGIQRGCHGDISGLHRPYFRCCGSE